jgi:outer membrane lipoprotein SlyB
MSRPFFRATATLTAAVMLSACVSTQAGRIGVDDGRDACRAEVVALDSTGDFFGEDIIRGAAVGALGGALLGGLASGRWEGALVGAVAGGAAGAATGYWVALQRQAQDQQAVTAQIMNDLSRDNAQLDRTQVAFNQLMDCRFHSAQRVRVAVREGRISRPAGQAQMADIRARTERDIQLARTISGRIGTRGAEFDTAIDNVVPGGKESVQRAVASRSQSVRVTARQSVPVRLTPSRSSAQVAEISAREVVSARPVRDGFTLVETSSGVRGYAPTEAFQTTRGQAAALGQAPEAAGGDVRSLAATNLVRREGFNDSLGNVERLAQSGGFELAG